MFRKFLTSGHLKTMVQTGNHSTREFGSVSICGRPRVSFKACHLEHHLVSHLWVISTYCSSFQEHLSHASSRRAVADRPSGWHLDPSTGRAAQPPWTCFQEAVRKPYGLKKACVPDIWGEEEEQTPRGQTPSEKVSPKARHLRHLMQLHTQLQRT